MICTSCGNTGFAGSSCPDCGSEKVKEDSAGQAPMPVLAPTVAPAPEPVLMPDVDMTVTTGPVVGTIKLPTGNGVELREGETFTVAHESSPNDPTFRIVGDDAVSGSLIAVSATNNKGVVTGGGGSGFALDFTIRFTPDQTVELPKDMAALIALLQSGRGKFTATGLKVGKATRFPLKF